MDYTMKDNLNISPMSTYVNDNSMANILSIREVTNYLRVTMYTNEDHTMLINFKKDKAYNFKKSGNSLYNIDIPEPEISPLTSKDNITQYYLYLL